MNKDVDVILEDLNCNFKSSDLVATLTAGEMQMLAIAKEHYIIIQRLYLLTSQQLHLQQKRNRSFV